MVKLAFPGTPAAAAAAEAEEKETHVEVYGQIKKVNPWISMGLLAITTACAGGVTIMTGVGDLKTTFTYLQSYKALLGANGSPHLVLALARVTRPNISRFFSVMSV
eukprot:g14970.t1